MYDLFLETRASQQIDRYVAANGGDAEDIKQKCYANARKYMLKRQADQSEQAWCNWWVNLCLGGDSHKEQTIDSLMYWYETPEGPDYWGDFSAY
jgi:hypothetical protein